MIKIEFPANRPDIATAIGEALMKIGGTTARTVGMAPELGAPYAAGTAWSVDTPEREAGQAAEHKHSTGTGATAAPLDSPDAELKPAAGDSQRRDMKGVAFDPTYCANAAEPFYGSGKEKGQWKAKRGLTAGVYESWYASQLAGLAPAASDEDSGNTTPVQTGAAFGAATTSSITAPAPRSAGEFMAWVAEKQTAGLLAQETINAAYFNLGIRVQDLFPPTPDNVVANNIAALHGELSRTAGA